MVVPHEDGDYCRCRRRYMVQPRVILYWAENSTINPTCLAPLYASRAIVVALKNAMRFMLPTGGGKGRET